MKKLILFPQIFWLFLFSVICINMSGCSDTTPGVKPDPAENSGYPYCKIKYVTPDRLPLSGGEFRVGVKAGANGTPIRVEVEVRKNDTDSCIATSETRDLENNTLTEFVFNTGSFRSGCNSPNQVYRIVSHAYTLCCLPSDTSSICRFLICYSAQLLTWGTPNQTLLDAYVEASRMPINYSWNVYDALSSVYKSYNNTLDPDSNLVSVNAEFSSLHTFAETNYFYAPTDTDLVYILNNFANNNRVDSSTYPYFIIFAHDHNRPANYIGISMHRGYSRWPWMQNWSFVFMERIRNIYATPTYNRQSIYNYTAVHELIHQIGKATESNDHDYHDGVFHSRCVLNLPASFDAGDFRRLTDFYRICDRHISKLRLQLGGNLITSASFTPDGRFISRSNEFNDKYTINMTLSKYKYRKFEPVVAKFEVVNTDKEPMKIKFLFDRHSGEGYVSVKDDRGNVWDTNKTFIATMGHGEPLYVIQPGDTMFISMPINAWGAVDELRGDYNFNQAGYFPPGRKYRAHFYTRYYDGFGKAVADVKTNEVEFEVMELDSTDENLIELYRQHKYQNVLSNYPDNPLTEHVWKEFLRINYETSIMPAIAKGEYLDLIQDYDNFFKRYPNSYYVLDDEFMQPYLIKLFKDSPSIKWSVKDFARGLRNEALRVYLSNGSTIYHISKIVKDYKRRTKSFKNKK